jgi:hypothetical protein
MDDDREQSLADAFADLLDRRAARSTAHPPELAPELAALSEIDRVLEPAAPLPDRLSGHKIIDQIGAGGMGRVLLAMDEALGRKVAIKTLAPRYAGDAGLRARFMDEARAMARLNHPHVARIYSLGSAEEPPHFVMEYLAGAPLTIATARLDFRGKAELLAKVALATHFLHDQGIVHRDLKPANILVDADLEPKLLDFGLALDLSGEENSAALRQVAGTPEYLSPEQAAGRPLDARSDVFSLGAILYELLTGAPPFRGDTVSDLLRSIREDEPALPRRRAPGVPRDLQNICLKAIEKDPAARYASAREMAGDLHRFLAGEAVLAEPAAYARLIAGKVGQHLRDLESWRHDQIVSEAEYDGIRKRYERLIEREDAWIMEARRLTLPQVTLYLGAWVLAVGATFLTLFSYPALAGAPAIAAAWAAAIPSAWLGIRNWNRGNSRVAIAFLLAFCLVAPIAALATTQEVRIFTSVTRGQLRLELFHRLEFAKQATNAQLWWALLAALPVCWWLRRFTRAPVFSLMFATYAALLCLASLLRMGMLDWLDHDPGRFYFHLLPCALLFLIAGFTFERTRRPDDSRYFYPFAVAFTWGGAERRRGLPRTVCQVVELGSALDPRPGRVPVHRERGHLLRSRPALPPAILAATAHRRPRLSVRDSRPRDDLSAAARNGRAIARGGPRVRMAASRRRLRVRVRQHPPPDEKLLRQRTSLLRHRRLPFAAAGLPRPRLLADHASCWRPRLDADSRQLCAPQSNPGSQPEKNPPAVVQSWPSRSAVLGWRHRTMKPLVLSLALAGAITLTGCSSLVSLNPFVTGEQAVMDPALLGIWTNQDGKEAYSVRQDGTGYSIRYLSDSSDAYQFKARLMVTDDVKLLDLVSANEDAFQIAVHTPVRVWTEGGTLRFAFLQSDWLKEQAGRQLPTVPVKDRTLIAAPSEAVGNFLAKIGADPKACDEPEVLRRVQ